MAFSFVVCIPSMMVLSISCVCSSICLACRMFSGDLNRENNFCSFIAVRVCRYESELAKLRVVACIATSNIVQIRIVKT